MNFLMSAVPEDEEECRAKSMMEKAGLCLLFAWKFVKPCGRLQVQIDMQGCR